MQKKSNLLSMSVSEGNSIAAADLTSKDSQSAFYWTSPSSLSADYYAAAAVYTLRKGIENTSNICCNSNFKFSTCVR